MILDAQGGDSEIRDRALGQICRIYWLPVYAFARGQGLQPADAEDLTQIGAGYQPRLCDNGRGPNATAGGRGGCAVLDSGGGGASWPFTSRKICR